MLAASFDAYYTVKAIHTMTVVITFGAAFAYPLAFAVARRHDRRSLPALHRIECTLERVLIVPGLLLVVVTGIFTTNLGHHWSEFYVKWGFAVTIAIGAVVVYLMIPTAERAAAVAARDVGASTQGAVALSSEYRDLTRRLLIVGSGLSVLVMITVLLMVVQFKP